MSQKIKLVLASGSPRRRELLSGLGIEFSIEVSELNEDIEIVHPEEYVKHLSLGKAKEVASRMKNQCASDEQILVLGADTIVVRDNHILNKPQTHEEAYDMLMSLSGRAHQVYSGVSIVRLPDGYSRSIFGTTSVYFRKLSEPEARFYANSEEPMDKAGAYALQGVASAFIQKVEGCYSNVIGLPVSDTVLLLREFGMRVMDSLT